MLDDATVTSVSLLHSMVLWLNVAFSRKILFLVDYGLSLLSNDVLIFSADGIFVVTEAMHTHNVSTLKYPMKTFKKMVCLLHYLYII